MAVFEYVALNNKGKRITGVVDADSVRAARQKLKLQNVFPTDVREKDADALSVNSDVTRFLRERKVNTQQLSLITRQLATLVRAGMPLVESLKALGEQVDHSRLRSIIADITDRVNEGSTLANALKAHPNVFPRVYPNMVASGEASGTLDLVLERLAELLEAQTALKRILVAALAYPVLMLVLCFGVIILLLTYVVPQLMLVFKDRSKLPTPTLIIITLSDFFKYYWWLLAIVLIGGLLLFTRYRNTPHGRRRTDELLLRIPILGNLVSKVSAAQFSHTLGSMLGSGVDLLTSLAIVKNIIGNVPMQDAIERAAIGVEEGRNLSRELETSKLFPRMLIHMVAIGERTGQLPQMLMRAAQNYESELQAIIGALTSILNPLLILFLAGIVGTILVAVLLPMLEMSSLVG